jgi:molecular chaperone DnaK (HSP70)
MDVRKGKQTVQNYPKSLTRLKKESSRIKDILSANKPHPKSINELQEDDGLKF